MASSTVTITTDDLDGSEGATTRPFSFLGQSYEIDLTDANAKKMEKDFGKYIQFGRKVGARRRPRAAATSKPKVTNAQIREWAAENGHEVSDRGQVRREVREAYIAAHEA